MTYDESRNSELPYADPDAIAPAERVEIAPKLLRLFERPSRYKVARGGRGSAKSWGFARAVLGRAIERDHPRRILCARELQNSIEDSVHALLKDQIHALGWGAMFNVLEREITARNGSEILFCGIKHNANRIRSLEGVDICWVEEAAKVSRESWNILVPTIRKPGSEIWVSYNPDLEDDPTHAMFRDESCAPPGSRIVDMNWQDNPWFPAELEREKDYLYRVDPEGAAHVWGGECRRNTQAAVLRGKWRIESLDTIGADGPYFGGDFGFSVDPSTLIRFWIVGRVLYIEHEAYGVGVELGDMHEFYERVPGSHTRRIRADSARPETISFLSRDFGTRKGFDIVAAEKWKGSVEDGIAFLRGFEAIVIHPRCTHAAQEARLWSYKVDRLTGDVTTDLAEGHEHVWDAVRYGLEPMIRRGGATSFIDYLRAQQKPKAQNQAVTNGA